MNDKQNCDDSPQPKDETSTEVKAKTEAEAKQETPEAPKAVPEEANPSIPDQAEPAKQEAAPDRSPSPPATRDSQTDQAAPPVEAKSVSAKKPQRFFAERTPPAIEIAPRILRHQSRRDFLVFGTVALAALTGAVSLLPQETLGRIGIHAN